MAINTKPVVLTKREIITPIVQALNRINEIQASRPSGDNKIVLQGLFVLAVSSFENSLIDSMAVIFKHIPDRLEVETDAALKVKDIIKGDGLAKIIERRLRNISYMNVENILEKYIQICRTAKGKILADIDKLKEIKATRNLLIHNNLKLNSTYDETAGPLKRESRSGKTLEIDAQYLNNSIAVLSGVLTNIKGQLEITYKDYTRLKAMNAMFKYILPTPIMEFENEFFILEAEDTIADGIKKTSRRKGLSHSESFLYDLWIAHSSVKKVHIPRGIFHSLGHSAQEKVNFLMKNIDLLKS